LRWWDWWGLSVGGVGGRWSIVDSEMNNHLRDER
jgi:hypothetical protein